MEKNSDAGKNGVGNHGAGGSRVVRAIRRMLVLVDDHTGIESFRALANDGWEIISTGKTAVVLRGLGIPYIPIEIVTDFPKNLGEEACLLHPEILKGIIADRNDRSQMMTLLHQGITPIDMVVANLNDFAKDERMENIEAGKTAIISAAIQNSEHVSVVVNQEDYYHVVCRVIKAGEIPQQVKKLLAWKASQLLAERSIDITSWLHNQYIGSVAVSAKKTSGHLVAG